MKKSFYLFAFVLCFFTFSASAFASIDCNQLHINVMNEMLDLGYTGAESEAIADAAYGACLELNEK